jgi:hypothetical protein
MSQGYGRHWCFEQFSVRPRRLAAPANGFTIHTGKVEVAYTLRQRGTTTKFSLDGQLLPQRHVFEYETSMSARQDDQEPSNLNDTVDHGPA